MKRHPLNILAEEAIRDAEWQDTFLDAEPQPGRIRAWLAEALQVAVGATLTVAGFYGLLFLALLRPVQ